MPVEFVRQNVCENGKCASTRLTGLTLDYDGSGRRISKTRMMKTAADGDWYVDNVTHYTGIGTEVRESYFGGAMNNAKVVVNLPQGLGRYLPEDAVDGLNGVSGSQLAGYRPPAKFEWYLKNHLGSTMLVYGTSAYSDPLNSGYKGGVKAAYDYRAFGERVDYTVPTDKITETFTGKELDDETQLSNHGARMLDPMLGMWISVDPKRQFASPYLYAGNGVNPVNGVDGDGNIITFATPREQQMFNQLFTSMTPEAQMRIGVLAESKNTYNLNYRPAQIVEKEEKLGDMVVKNSYTKQGQFVPTENGGEIYFDGSAQSLGHELGGHGFQFEYMLNNAYIYDAYESFGSAAAKSYKDQYRNDINFRMSMEKDAAEVGGHDFDESYYE